MSADLSTTRAELVRAVLHAAAASLTTAEIAERCRLTERLTHDVLQALLASGDVQRGGRGRKAPPGMKQYRWRLAPVPDPSEHVRRDASRTGGSSQHVPLPADGS